MGVDFVPLGALAPEGEHHAVATLTPAAPMSAASAAAGASLAPESPIAAPPPAASTSGLFGAPIDDARRPARTPPPAPNWELKPVPRDRDSIVKALADLRKRYESDAPHRDFVTSFQHIVFDDGDPCARLMFIGEAPGADEDRTGVPFVGRAGQLLNKMIGAMGLKREQVYIANVLKTRPVDNATPTSEEIRACAPYLFEQIRIVRPEVIVTLGLPATRALLDTMESMSRLRGTWASFTPPGPDAKPIPVMPTYHPAFLLRSYTDENRAKVWSDLQQVMQRLGLPGKAAAE